MATTEEKTTNEELIRQMYGSNLASQKSQLQQSYETADAELTAAKENNAKITDQNLTRTAVEGQKAAMNMAQLHAAQGLSSGARAQARISLENQNTANMTALRVAQQEADAQVERERALLAKEYSSAIAKAQADNDLQLAEALYEEARRQEEALLSNQSSGALNISEASELEAAARAAYEQYGEKGLENYLRYLESCGVNPAAVTGLYDYITNTKPSVGEQFVSSVKGLFGGNGGR